ncbi:MAG TPA: ComEA family DNA-binding protein [Streptosporangiaceae bacterium]|jgi:competence protein ComEA
MARLRALVTGDELDPGRPGLRVLITVAVVAALVAVAFWWRSRPHAEPLPAPAPVAPAASRQAPMGSPGALGSPPAPGLTPPVPASASPSATAVVVDVAGKVRHPGVVRLPPGSRVVDAIRAAGGVRSGAHTDTLNLARVVVDGEQIVVGAASAAGQTPPPGVPPAGATPGATPGTPVSLNNGTAEQFDTLPGVGPVLAKRIIDYRTQHGGFHSVDELGDVQGIGPKRMADLKPLVTP